MEFQIILVVFVLNACVLGLAFAAAWALNKAARR